MELFEAELHSVFLHGFGSIGQYDDIQNLLTYNGFGWLLKQCVRSPVSRLSPDG